MFRKNIVPMLRRFSTVSQVNYAPTMTSISTPFSLGEGPWWCTKKQEFMCVDILNFEAKRLRGGKWETRKFDKATCSILSKENSKNNDEFLVCVGLDIWSYNWETEEKTLITTLDTHKTDNRINDAKCDRQGRFWVGTMGVEPQPLQIEPNKGCLYRVGENGATDPMCKKLTIANGLCWSPDNKFMFYIDSTTRRVDRFNFDAETGHISNRSRFYFFEEEEGYPDGMTIDTSGNLLVACYSGGRILHIDGKTGKRLGSIKMPVSKVTSVCFGGPNLDELYVTSAYVGMSDVERKQEPDSGCTYLLKDSGLVGLPERGFAF